MLRAQLICALKTILIAEFVVRMHSNNTEAGSLH
jgi:hypothetical protein